MRIFYLTDKIRVVDYPQIEIHDLCLTLFKGKNQKIIPLTRKNEKTGRNNFANE